jgi:predicted ArsR family transcriptional regulator
VGLGADRREEVLPRTRPLTPDSAFFRPPSGFLRDYGRRSAILTIHQLPDSRRAILIALKQHGASTIARLADALELTGEAVRQQLLQLQRDGWIEARTGRDALERGRTGRPATLYRLSEAGDHLFPKHYDALTIVMIDAIGEELGADATKRVLARVTEDRVTSMGALVRDLPLPEKILSLKNWYLEDDPYMEAVASNDDYRLVERNCPFYNTAMRRPALCSVSVNALTKIFGVRVVREERFQNGDGRCVFRVLKNEPIDPATWEFALEADLSA